MGSVLYLDRGMRRRRNGGAAAAVRVQTHAPSLLRPGYNCWAVSRAERVALLVDAADYYQAFCEAALRARHSITILAWDFNSQTRLHFDPVEANGPPALLGEFLNWLVQRRHSLHINVLNWDYPMVFGADREFPPLYGFGWTPARRVHLRYDDTHPFAGCQHQKVVVIDDAVAFIGGVDLTVRRWDTCEHLAHDPRRVAYGKPYPPFHDLMVLLDGEAARSLATLSRERWHAATGNKLKPIAPGARDDDPWPPSFAAALQSVEVGIARTAPPRGELPAIKEVEKLYLDMIAAAEKSLYIENQYFTAPRIAAALEKRLAEPNGPEIILVLRLLSHGWLEEHTMHVLRTRLIERLRKADRHGRFHVYYPHVPGLPQGCCLDVHSKVMVVDERVLRIGSSNLCNRSLGLDTEADVAIEARGRPQVANVIRRFREHLLAEHLGVPAEKVRVEIDRAASLQRAIEALAHDGRSLRELATLPEWPEAIVNVAAVADPDEPIALDALLVDRHQEGEETPLEKPQWVQLGVLAVLVIALTAIWRWTPLAYTVSPEAVISWAKDFGERWWAPAVVMLLYTPACLVMFPRPLITLAAVIAFGPWLGFGYALVGICASAVITYYIGRRLKRDNVRRLAGPQLDRMIEVLKKYGLLAMTLLRLVPIAPFAVESIVAGAIHMRLWHVVAGTAIGLLPGTAATTLFGDAIETALTGAGPVNWWLVGAAVGLLGGGIVAVKRWFMRMSRRIHAVDEQAGREPR